MISVCIPTYNGEKFIRSQLLSILNQLSEKDEVIISDDSSVDDTVAIIKSINDSRIILLENNQFHSPIYNLENALKCAKGDYIFLSDQDDEWLSNKVDVCVRNLDSCDLLIHNADVVDIAGELLFSSFFLLNHTRKGKVYNLIKNGYLGCCMCFKKQLLKIILPFPENLPMHDIYIGNMAAFNKFKVKFISEKLIHYRRHGNNASITAEKSKRRISSRIFDRLIILRYIITALKKGMK